VLKWARMHGCPWDSDTCTNTAASGRLAVLQWAREHGCEWDKFTCEFRRSARTTGGVEVGAGA